MNFKYDFKMLHILDMISIVQCFLHHATGKEVKIDPNKIVGQPSQEKLLNKAYIVTNKWYNRCVIHEFNF